MKITDGTRTVELKVLGLNDIDSAEDLLEAGNLEYDTEKEAYKVDSITEVIRDLEAESNDYNENLRIFVDGERVEF